LRNPIESRSITETTEYDILFTVVIYIVRSSATTGFSLVAAPELKHKVG